VPAGRALVLGATGFAGRHFLDAARSGGQDVVSAARDHGAADVVCDLLEPESIRAALAESQPDAVVNLAGAASVGRSWDDPDATMAVNATGVVNLLEAVSAHAPGARVLCASSGEVYGAPADSDLPLTEDAPLRPVNPYARSKAEMERACELFSRDGLEIALMRAFNHIGPGQSDSFAASSFARQIAAAEAEGRDAVELRTGDLSPERDFSDVRDVVRAYALAVEHRLTGAYNVCSGKAVPIGALVDGLAGHSRVEVSVAVDESRLRPDEAPRVFGSFDRMQEATGWEPEIALDRTLGDLLEWWRGRVKQ
jgi:GDP-4-dehydro-6-deoxy-D-mannose reductase